MCSTINEQDQHELQAGDRRLTGHTIVSKDETNTPTENNGDQTLVDVNETIDERSCVAESPSCGAPFKTALRSLSQLVRKGRSMLWHRNQGSDREEGSTSKPSRFIVRSLDEPSTGYPNVATFNDSNPSFMVYRRFGYLQARALLERQDELRMLEAELGQFDDENDDQLITRCVEEEELAPRKALFERIENVLGRYSALMIASQQITSFYRPSASEYQSVLNYLDNEKPLYKDDRSYILHRDDLVTLRPGREHAWLDRAIEYTLRKLHRPFPLLKRIFSDEMSDLKTRGRYEVYFCEERINVCANLIITLMILALLIVPTYLLYREVSHASPFTSHEMAVSIGILLVFTLAFSAALSLFTRAKRHEILGAAAAYCAVLVVFFGNINT